ncbi:MAG: DUF4175 domain-containing protein [Nitrospira sp.]|nr:DUF4175 domain-containing protein [Nitrospira sp.]
MLRALPALETQPKSRASARSHGAGSPLQWPAVAAVRARWLRLTGTAGTLRVAASVALVVFVGGLADWLWEMPRFARAAWLLLDAAVVLYAGWRWWVLPWRALPSRDGLALWIERRHPALRSRLISAVQLSRASFEAPEATAFVGRLVDDADHEAKALDPKVMVPAEDLKACLRWTLPALAGVLLVFAWAWPSSWALLRRAVLDDVPVPRKTRFLELSGAKVIGRGDDFAMVARVEGLVPSSGRVQIRHPSGRLQKLNLDPDPQVRGRFERLLANVPASFRYQIMVGDAVSEEFTVEVLPRPVVTNLVVTQTLPAYTGLPARTLGPGALSVLKGSRLRLEGEANHPLHNAELRLMGTEQVQSATVDAADPRRFAVEFEVDDARLSGFAMDLVDQKQIASKDPAVHALEVVADQPPGVRILHPNRREELAMSRSTVLISFEATDDYGLAGVSIAYQRAGTTNGVPERIDLDLGESVASEVRRRFEWGLGTVKPSLAEGTMVEFWVEATDRRQDGGPGVGRSERYLLRIVTEAEKRADLLSRAGDAIGRLGDVALGQERLNETLGRIILEKPSPRR